MIIKEKTIKLQEFSNEYSYVFSDKSNIYEDALFFDLEHYVYKKPICIGVFGCCYYDKDKNELVVTQYMIENSTDADSILFLAVKYFKDMYKKYGKRYIITFSGNNDFTVINYLFDKHNIDYQVNKEYISIDIQSEYEKKCKKNIGLKNLEKKFNIERDSELISGSNLAKTFSKVVKDEKYFERMPKEKVTKILSYNEQDVTSLFYIFTKWNKYIDELNE